MSLFIKVFVRKGLFFVCLLFSSSLFANGLTESLSEEIKNDLSQADKIEISFGWWGEDGFDINTPEVIITDIDTIKKSLSFFTDTPDYMAECGYDCEVVFYKNNEAILIEPILVNFSNCSQIVYQYKDIQRCIKMSNSAVKYFEELYEELKAQKINNDI